MNKLSLSKRIGARMQFRSLLALTLLAGHASAQQMPAMPTLESMPPEMPLPLSPTTLPLTLPTSLPTIELPGLPTQAVPAFGELVPATKTSEPSASGKATWNAKQHTTWLLGMRARSPMATRPVALVENAGPTWTGRSADRLTMVTAVPDASIPSSVPALPGHPMLIGAPMMPGLGNDGVIPVQYTEAVGLADTIDLPEVPEHARHELASTSDDCTEVSDQGPVLADHQAPVTKTGNGATVPPVAHAFQAAPRNLNAGPVITGPAPKLPVEQWSADSLLHVDVSGVDADAIVKAPAQASSLIDGLDLKPRIGFSLQDSNEPTDTARVASSPARSNPVSIHEGFAPRKANTSPSNANHAARIHTQVGSSAGDSLRMSLPGTQSFSLSDQGSTAKGNSLAKANSGPVENRLSDNDSETVHNRLSDDDANANSLSKTPTSTKPSTGRQPIIFKLADSNRATENTGAGGKRTASQLDSKASEAPVAKESLLIDIPSTLANLEPSPRTTVPPAEMPAPALLGAALEKLGTKAASETVSNTVSDATTGPKTDSTKSESLLAAAPTMPPLATMPSTPPLVLSKPAMLPPALPGLLPSNLPLNSLAQSQPLEIAKSPTGAEPATTESLEATDPIIKSAEKRSLSDSNPMAMRRPVVRAASVALPIVEQSQDGLQVSGEQDESAQLRSYAKVATKMQQVIKQKYPESRLRVSSNEDGLVLEGIAANETEANKILAFVRKTSLCPVADRVSAQR